MCYNFYKYRKGAGNMKRTYTQEEKQSVIDRFISGEPSASIESELEGSDFNGAFMSKPHEKDIFVFSEVRVELLVKSS